jgi:hypothetical protein
MSGHASAAIMTTPSDPRALGADDRDLQPGQVVGDYVVEQKLGEGGFGTVFKAAHPLIGKVVAIKVLNRQYSAQPEMVSRFVAEARAVNQIRHRHIIDIFGFGQLDDGRHYYVMEYLEGEPLNDHLDRVGRLDLASALPILRAVAKALDAAHAKGIAHRDLKPENVFLVTESDGTVFPKLLDFGIAKLLIADDQLKHKTRTGAPIGTPYYMSPEQCRGRDVDHRTDVYAFGCVTYKLLTGAVPFDGEDYMSILMSQMGDPTPSASAKWPDLPPSVDNVIGWMMQKDPAARPASVVAAVRALEDAAAAAGIVVAPAGTAAMTAQHGAQRTPSGLLPARTPGSRQIDSIAGGVTLPSGNAVATPTPAGSIMTPPPAQPIAAPPKRRIWTFVLAATGPIVALVVTFFLIKRGQDADRDTIEPGNTRDVAGSSPPDPDKGSGRTGDTAGGGGSGSDNGAGDGSTTQDTDEPDELTEIEILDMPPGGRVYDTSGQTEFETTTRDGRTFVKIPISDNEPVPLRINWRDGSELISVKPTDKTVKVKRRPNANPKSDGKPTGSGSASGAPPPPGGDKSNATERPKF